MTQVNEYMDEEVNAAMLATKVKDYWHDRGFKNVTTWVIKESTGHGKGPVWCTRSNIVAVMEHG